MFEGSLVESRGLAVSGTQRWTALGSLTLQLGVAGLLIAIPLLRPQALPVLMAAPRLEMPIPVRPPVALVRPAAGAVATGVRVAAAAPVSASPGARFVFPKAGDTAEEPAPEVTMDLGMGSAGPGLPGVVSTSGSGPGANVVMARPKVQGPVTVSRGVTEGMLLAPIRPVYPAIAVAAHQQGQVVMEAVISKVGRIESLRVVSGPEMLRGAALEAVQAARYRPYLLSGEPTEVQTTITVVFRLAS